MLRVSVMMSQMFDECSSAYYSTSSLISFLYITEAGQADVPLSRDFMESELGVKTVSKTRKV